MSDFDNVWQQVQNNLSIAEDVSAILDEAAKNHRQQITKICAERDAAVALGKRLAHELNELSEDIGTDGKCHCLFIKGRAIPTLDEARAAGWLED